MRKKILIDVDEVICNPGFLYLINKFLGTSYEQDYFKEYFMDSIIGDEERQQEFYKFYLNYNSYDYAEIFPGAYDTLKDLNEVYDVYLCSACVNPFLIQNSGRFFMDKYNFLIKNFPFLDPNKFIFTNTKNMIEADIQIDDRLNNLQGGVETKLLFTSYHNKEITEDDLKRNNVIRVGTTTTNGWSDIRKILLEGNNENS